MPKFKFRPNKSIDGTNEASNGTSAKWAEQIIAVYRWTRYPSGDDNECPISDLISDMLHLADRDGLDAEHLLESAKARWEEER